MPLYRGWLVWVLGYQFTIYYMKVNIGAFWRIRLSDPCASAMQPRVALTTCCNYAQFTSPDVTRQNCFVVSRRAVWIESATVCGNPTQSEQSASGPCNSFYCLGHFKNVYDDDDDDDASFTNSNCVSVLYVFVSYPPSPEKNHSTFRKIFNTRSQETVDACLEMSGCLQAERTIAIRKRKLLNKFCVIRNALCMVFVAIAKTELESCCTDV